MRRREIITLLGGAAAGWPLTVQAQQPDQIRRVGVLTGDGENDPEVKSRLAAFEQGLERLGWSVGHNVQIQYRFAENNPERYGDLAKDLVRLRPDVLLGYTTTVALALARQSQTLPIVFASVSDPVGSGLVASLAQPRGNVTGLMLYEEGIAGKWLAMLKEISPNLMRAALIADPRRTSYDYFLRTAETAARLLGIELASRPIATAVDIENVIASLARESDAGLVVLPGTPVEHRELVISLTARYRLPAVYPFRLFVAAGGLMSYGTDFLKHSQQAASYVDRILRGANPADLPVETPTKYETVLNLKTAKALGFEVPATLLVRADEVIE